MASSMKQHIFYEPSSPKILTAAFNTLCEDFSQAFNDELFTDITIVANNKKEIRANKIMLTARSAHFKKMFGDKYIENQMIRIELKFEIEAIEAMLWYFYTSEVPNISDVADQLLGLAEMYELTELKAMCEKNLVPQINDSNCPEMLDLAELHCACRLKKATNEYIHENINKLRFTEAWKRLNKDVVEKLFDENASPSKLAKVPYCESISSGDSNSPTPRNQRVKSLVTDLSEAFDGKLHVDITIFAKGGEKIEAHKFVLAARSKYLKAMMTCLGSQSINFVNLEINVIEALLRYLYTCEVPIMLNLADRLLEAAEMFELTDLKAMCERKLVFQINDSNFPEMLKLADTQKASKLKAAAIHFINDNSLVLRSSEHWSRLTKENIYDLMFKELNTPPPSKRIKPSPKN